MEKIKSRKFWMAVVSAVLLVLNEGLGLKVPSDTILSFTGVIMAYLFGQSYVDGKQKSTQQVTQHIITNAQPEPLEDDALEGNTDSESITEDETQQQSDNNALAQLEAERLAKIAEIEKQLEELKAATPTV